MKNRFAQMQEQLTSPTTATTCESSTGSLEEPNEEFHDGFCNDHQTPQTDSLTRESLCDEEKLQDQGVDRDLDNDYCFNIAGKDENEKNFYNQYLEEAETGEDLKGLVRHLVSVLEQKDQEIDDLKQRLQFQIVSNVAKR